MSVFPELLLKKTIESLKELPYEALQEVLTELNEQIIKRRSGRRAEGLAKIREVELEIGIPVEEILVFVPPPGYKRGPRVARYRHPVDKDLMWTGYGPRPRWVLDWLAGGRLMSEIAVPPDTAPS